MPIYRRFAELKIKLVLFRCKVFDEKIDDRSKAIVELSDRQNQKCENYKGSQVCLEKYEEKSDGIHACHLIIKKVKEDHERDYYFLANADPKDRDIDEKSDFIELRYVEKPKKTILGIDDKTYEGSNNRNVKVEEGDWDVSCTAEDGIDVKCSLWIGDQPFIDARDNECRNTRSGEE